MSADRVAALPLKSADVKVCHRYFFSSPVNSQSTDLPNSRLMESSARRVAPGGVLSQLPCSHL